MKNKRKITYLSLIQTIRRIVNLNNPVTIKTDFELAAIEAFCEEFPTAKISGCQFHLGQAIFRKVQSLGLVSLYRLNPDVKKFVRALSCLPYVALARIVETFNEFRYHQDFPICLIPVYEYFYENYINFGTARFSTDLWHFGNNLNINIPRTNNATEGWHNAFKSTFEDSRKSVPLLISKLKNEEDFVRIKSLRQESGEVLLRKKKYLLLERTVQNYLEECANNNFGCEFVFDLIYYISYNKSWLFVLLECLLILNNIKYKCLL